MAAVSTFDEWLEDQITVRKQLWFNNFEETMDSLNVAPQTSSVQRTSEACDATIKIVLDSYQAFGTALQPLRAGSTADLRLQSLDAELRSTGARNKKNKLTQFDELATLYNRALLSKKVKPVVDKV